MSELFKILAQPMDPEELWGPRDGSSYDHWDSSDLVTILIFLGLIALGVVLYFLPRFISSYHRSIKIQKWRKEMHMDKIDGIIAQHYEEEAKRSKNNN